MQPKIRNLCLSLENRILNLHPFNPEQVCCCIATWFMENKILFLMKEYDGCGLDELLKLNFKDYPTELSIYGDGKAKDLFGAKIIKSDKYRLINKIRVLKDQKSLRLVYEELNSVIFDSLVVSVDLDLACECPQWSPSDYRVMLNEATDEIVFACINCGKKFYPHTLTECQINCNLTIPKREYFIN
nr:hypothetical protein [uncultured Campylobacter sp.]